MIIHAVKISSRISQFSWQPSLVQTDVCVQPEMGVEAWASETEA